MRFTFVAAALFFLSGLPSALGKCDQVCKICPGQAGFIHEDPADGTCRCYGCEPTDCTDSWPDASTKCPGTCSRLCA
ncbi:unnamed protein product [Zymoseptoria tritici ST99CH_1E4]|uniref:4Fe-4S ferredoxin-type domain-containing protein n=1 Tax=Zymoseptoria tritici ST99CH_1E4 TaxID=1276532 RepID=A0A2H1GGI0_ZYMTR|nr:unnamed protein product [Zymoseptoria tritici ST99CH_1E4]